MILERVSSGLSGPAILSGFALAVANMIPVFGVILWNWGLFEIVGIYWSEILIIGILNIPRMLMAQKRREISDGVPASKSFLVFLFVIQFGLFSVFHSFFVFFLKESGIHSLITAAPDLLLIVAKATTWGLVFMILGHLFSFFWNFVGQREYREMVVEDRVYQPFKRTVVLQILVLFAAYAISLYGPTTILLIAFIGVKTAFDLGFHFFYHAKEGEAENRFVLARQR